MRLLPVLNRSYRGEPLYELLQYASSAVGLGVIAWYLARALRELPAADSPAAGPAADSGAYSGGPGRRLRLSPRTRSAVVALVGCAATAGAAERLSRWGRGPLRDARLLDLVPTVAFGGGTGAVVGLALYAALTRLPVARRAVRREG